MADTTNNSIIVIMGEISKTSEYISIVIGGLFGLTTIMLAVFSIISNEVTKKTSGFSLIDLKRYKRFLLLLPIYMVFVTTFIMIIFPQLNNEFFLIFSSIIIIATVTLQTYLILQPLYSPNKAKTAIINNRINKFKKRMKDSKSPVKIKKLLEDEENEIFDLIAYDNKDNNYILYEDKIKIYESYISIINNNSSKFNKQVNIKLIEIGFKIFGDKFLNISETFLFPETILLEILLEKNNKNFNLKYHKKIFELFHTLFESYRKGKPIEECYSDEQWVAFWLQTIRNKEAINYVIDYVFDTDKWSYSDTAFIKLILSLSCKTFLVFESIYKSKLSADKFERFKNVMIAFDSKSELETENSEFAKIFNLIVKTLKEE